MRIKLHCENILTLQTSFTFTRVLAQDEFVDVFNILIDVITRFIVTVLLRHTRRERINQICDLKQTKQLSWCLLTAKLTLNVSECHYSALCGY